MTANIRKKNYSKYETMKKKFKNTNCHEFTIN